MAFTFFFRDILTIEEAVKEVIPQVGGRSHVYIWDAGCAMGPELYTLAIILAENMGKFAFRNLKIYATDIDEGGNFGETIAGGIYPYEELKRIPEDIFKQYFSPCGEEGNYKINDILKERVVFMKHDLLTLKSVRNDFNLIICKNVLLHFPLSERIKVLQMFYDSLLPGGILAMENTQDMPEVLVPKFEKTRNGIQVYRKIQ